MKLENKNILVTGADGFIGSHLVESLFQLGARVNALSYYNSFNNWGWLESINCRDQVNIICGDIRDAEFINSITKDIDVVFHLAALIAIPYSYVATSSYVQTNITGTLNVLQGALQNNVKRFLHTSTSEVYGTARYNPIDEIHPLQPQSPYSASKIGADAIAESFYKTFDLQLSIVRPFNTYGPRQSARAIIPTVITQLLDGQQEVCLGNLHPTRNFNYVKDICDGFINIAESDNTIGEVVNVGTEYEISMNDLVFMIGTLMDMELKIASDNKRIRPISSEVDRLSCNNSKLIKLTGKSPMTSLKSGLSQTIKWFRDERNLIKYKSDIYNV
ncbi:MAG: SDR family NAD(P)-dependent oxidoreductase [Gammaproteobacteria bacterium]|jgi:NAD dependent epimerase/dehydratase